GMDVDCEGGELAFFDAESGDEADHGGVVGAKMGFSGEELEAAGGAFGGEAFAQTGVAAHAAAESDNGEAGVLDGAHGFANEDVDDGFLERGADVFDAIIAEFGKHVADGSLESAEAEREIVRVHHASRKMVALGVAAGGEVVDVRAAGVGKAKQLADFVEGFAGGIVDGLAEEFVIGEGVDLNQEGVAAADDEADGGAYVFSEEGQEQVTLEMIDGVKRKSARDRQAFGDGASDHE